MTYWVTMTDKFLSYWGMSKDKINKLVLECETWEEVQKVKRYSKTRSEMKYVSISTKKPYYNKERYYTNYHDKNDYTNWYNH